jgi:hypothetical protein
MDYLNICIFSFCRSFLLCCTPSIQLNMSSRNSSFDIGAAMDQPSSPIDSSPPDWMRSSPNKRAHSPTDEEDDGHNSDRVIDPALRNEGPSGAAIVPRQASQNLTTFAKRYATKRKLNPQQVNEVLTFVAVRKSLGDDVTTTNYNNTGSSTSTPDKVVYAYSCAGRETREHNNCRTRLGAFEWTPGMHLCKFSNNTEY